MQFDSCGKPLPVYFGPAWTKTERVVLEVARAILWTLSGEYECDDVVLRTRRNNYKEEEEEEE